MLGKLFNVGDDLRSRSGGLRPGLLLVLLLLATAVLSFVLGYPVYRAHKERRALTNAAAYLDKGDFRNAAICARQALALNESNLAACHILASLADRAGAPQLLDWRRRIVALDPTIDNRLHLAAAALKIEPAPWPTAAETLHFLATGPPPHAVLALPGELPTNRVAFHVLSAELALRQNQAERAEAHFTEAMRLDPANPLHALNVAVLRLASTNDTVADAARATLRHLAEDTNVAPLALRWLVDDSLKRKDPAAAERFSTRLLAHPACLLQDHFQHLEVLRQGASAEFKSFLDATQQAVSTNPPAVRSLALWMAGCGLANEACEWLAQLPTELRKQQPVPLATAECLATAGKWAALRRHLDSDNWEEADFMRLAWLSRVAAELHEDVQAEGHWRLAVRQAGDRLGPLTMLADLARTWSRGKHREEMLWRIVSTFPQEQWAVIELDGIYSAAGNTRGLHKLYSALVASPAADHIAKNNFAAVSMLLGLNRDKAFEVAEEVHQARPEDAVAASTYAFSLHLRGRTKDGLAVLEKLDGEALARHPVGLYYAVLLAADGQGAKVAPYLEAVEVKQLLPEEKLLLEETARVSNNKPANHD